MSFRLDDPLATYRFPYGAGGAAVLLRDADVRAAGFDVGTELVDVERDAWDHHRPMVGRFDGCRGCDGVPADAWLGGFLRPAVGLGVHPVEFGDRSVTSVGVEVEAASHEPGFEVQLKGGDVLHGHVVAEVE